MRRKKIIYYLAKGLGTPRSDGSGPRLAIDRMPFGLLSYNIRYFALEKINNIFCDPHYVEWETGTTESELDDSANSPGILQQAWQETFQESTQTGDVANNDNRGVHRSFGAGMDNLVEVIGDLHIESDREACCQVVIGDQQLMAEFWGAW